MTTPTARIGWGRNGRGQDIPGWVCCKCGQDLAYLVGTFGGGLPSVHLRRGLIRLPQDRDGLPAFGLPPREMIGKQRRTGRPEERPRRIRGSDFSNGRRFEKTDVPPMQWAFERTPLPLFVYCPRVGVCGIGQILNLPMEEALSRLVIG